MKVYSKTQVDSLIKLEIKKAMNGVESRCITAVQNTLSNMLIESDRSALTAIEERLQTLEIDQVVHLRDIPKSNKSVARKKFVTRLNGEK